jgi:hypothetical protein
MTSSRDSSAVAHMSAFASPSSSIQGGGFSSGRSKAWPKYPASTPARCFTRPRRFVPVLTIGRRTSYSDRPSSFQTMASRPVWT